MAKYLVYKLNLKDRYWLWDVEGEKAYWLRMIGDYELEHSSLSKPTDDTPEREFVMEVDV